MLLTLLPDTYNGVLGFSGTTCLACDDAVQFPGGGPAGYTSYAAAQQCAVERVDLLCKGGE